MDKVQQKDSSLLLNTIATDIQRRAPSTTSHTVSLRHILILSSIYVQVHQVSFILQIFLPKYCVILLQLAIKEDCHKIIN
jgi:hypothetical protein